MRKSTILVDIPANVKQVWDVVTNNDKFDWRSDLSNIKVVNDDTFVECSKNGIETEFKISDKQYCQFYSFVFGNNNMRGKWTGKFFTENDHTTKLEFTEEIEIKNFFVEILSYLFFNIKKMQRQYMKDLIQEVNRKS